MSVDVMPGLSVVVPVFNEEDVLPLFAERLRPVLGRSKYPLAKMIRLALDSITGFSAAPLRVAVTGTRRPVGVPA